jgi:hypothetical protein
MTRLTACLVGVVSVGVVVAAQQAPAPAGESLKGAVLKGRAPVSDDVLRVKLPRPLEADLTNGVHLIVLEDHRAPTVSFQVLIQGAGGYYDPTELPGVADRAFWPALDAGGGRPDQSDVSGG